MIQEIPTPVGAAARNDIAILQVRYIWNVGRALLVRVVGAADFRQDLRMQHCGRAMHAPACAYSVSAAGGQKKVEKLLIWCLTNCQVRGNISKLSARAARQSKACEKV